MINDIIESKTKTVVGKITGCNMMLILHAILPALNIIIPEGTTPREIKIDINPDVNEPSIVGVKCEYL